MACWNRREGRNSPKIMQNAARFLGSPGRVKKINKIP